MPSSAGPPHSPTSSPCGRLPTVSLLPELDAFYTEHRRCGDLDGGVDGPACGSRASAGPAWPAVLTKATHLTSTVEPPHHPGMDRRGFLLTSLPGSSPRRSPRTTPPRRTT